jgi:hypothetical protein
VRTATAVRSPSLPKIGFGLHGTVFTHPIGEHWCRHRILDRRRFPLTVPYRHGSNWCHRVTSRWRYEAQCDRGDEASLQHTFAEDMHPLYIAEACHAASSTATQDTNKTLGITPVEPSPAALAAGMHTTSLPYKPPAWPMLRRLCTMYKHGMSWTQQALLLQCNHGNSNTTSRTTGVHKTMLYTPTMVSTLHQRLAPVNSVAAVLPSKPLMCHTTTCTHTLHGLGHMHCMKQHSQCTPVTLANSLR